MALRNLQTVEEVVSELGGPSAVGELTGRLSVSAVPTWKLRKGFPTNTYAVLRAALLAKGATAPASLWGMTEAQPERAASQ